MIIFKKSSKLFIFLIMLFCLFQKNPIYASENKTDNKVIHVLLEQPYPYISKAQLVNFYTFKELSQMLKLNDYPGYNSGPDNKLNVKIKNAPSNLLGVYFDGGKRERKDDFFTLEDLRELSKKSDVKKVYFFYDNTDYCDLTLELQFDKQIDFPTNNKNWGTKQEFRYWWQSYSNWRNHWYKKKVSTEKDYLLSKYDTQGFRLDINIHEKDTILNVPFYSAYYIYQNDQNFLKIKNFALKEDLGNGIHINYDKPFLNFHTENLLGKWVKKIYNDWIGYIPIVGSVRSGIELTEGLIQRHEEQIIDNGVDLVLDMITLGYGKFVAKTGKSATNLLSKEIKKFGIKQINDKNKFKKMLKKEFQKKLLKKIKEKKIKWFKNKLKKYFIVQNPIIINLDEHHKLNILQKPKPPYNNINNTDSVVIVERQGIISELKDIKQLSNI